MDPNLNVQDDPEQKEMENAHIEDMTKFVGNILQEMQKKFEDVSTQIASKLDEMNNRVDQLEEHVQGLVHQVEEYDRKEKAQSKKN